MDDVWLHVFSRFPPKELLQFEVVSKDWRCLIGEIFRKRQNLNLVEDFPGCVRESQSMKNIIERHSPALTDILICVKPQSERVSVCTSEHHISRKVIKAINNTVSRLKKLRIERMNLTVGAVEEIANLPDCIQELSILNCSLSCNNPETALIAQNSFKTFFQRCTKLKKFEIAWRGFCFDNFELTDDLTSYIPDSVEELNISAGCSLKITTLEFLEKKRLRSFALQRSFISFKDLKYFIPMADSLISLDLTSSINILEVGEIGKLKNLQNLWLGNMREGVDDKGFMDILNGCRSLESLCIENLPQLTEKSLRLISLLKNLKKLEAACTTFNDNACISLAKLQQLEYLDVKFCRNISPVGIRHLLGLKTLRRLELLGIPSFSAQILTEFTFLPGILIIDNYSSICPIRIPPIPAPA